MDKQGEADEAHRKFRDESSDFLSYLKLWDFYHEQAKHLSTTKLRKLCQTNFLSFVRMREWHDIHSQLRELVGEMGLTRRTETGTSERPSSHPPVVRPRRRGGRARGRRGNTSQPQSGEPAARP
jgi:hypothetical protein